MIQDLKHNFLILAYIFLRENERDVGTREGFAVSLGIRTESIGIVMSGHALLQLASLTAFMSYDSPVAGAGCEL